MKRIPKTRKKARSTDIRQYARKIIACHVDEMSRPLRPVDATLEDELRELRDAGVIACANGEWYLRGKPPVWGQGAES